MQRALKRLWKLAEHLETEGMHNIAEELFEIHDEIKFHSFGRMPIPWKPFVNLDFKTIQKIAKVLGSRSYDPRTMRTATAIVLAKHGGKMTVHELAEELGTYPSNVISFIKPSGNIIRREGNYIVMDKDFVKIVKNILEGDGNG